MKKCVRALVILLVISTLFSCDMRQEMNDAEKNSAFEEFIGIVQNEDVWSDNYIFVSDSGSILCQDRVIYTDLNSNATEEVLLAEFNEVKNYFMSEIGSINKEKISLHGYVLDFKNKSCNVTVYSAGNDEVELKFNFYLDNNSGIEIHCNEADQDTGKSFDVFLNLDDVKRNNIISKYNIEAPEIEGD